MVLYTKNRTDVPIWHGKHILKSATKPVTLCVHFVVHVCKKRVGRAVYDSAI